MAPTRSVAWRKPRRPGRSRSRSTRLNPTYTGRWAPSTRAAIRTSGRKEPTRARCASIQSTTALFNLGNLYLSLGRLDAAEDLLQRAAPRGGYGSLGRVYAAQGRWKEAAAAFEKGVAEPGDRAPLGKASDYADLGQALMILRRDAEATRALTTSLEAYRVVERRHRKLEPGLGQVAYHLARLAGRGGDIDQARSYLEQAFQRDPKLRRQSLGEPDLDKVREAPSERRRAE